MQCPRALYGPRKVGNVRDAGTEAASLLYEEVYHLCVF